MNIQRVKQGARITLYNGIYMILLGIYQVFFIKTNMRITFNSIFLLWGFFARYNSNVAYLFQLFNILIGILLISQGILIVYLSDFIIKRKEKMTWTILFLSGIISWAALLVISILFNNWLLIVLTAIGWLTFLLGMVIPIKYYIEKNYKEY
ncbi:hypothetical protein J4218_05845 [Candidatus Pacearchaeota archaeon]|nr:hypothetical protein [Candidatus Pacearchaeota archaeon]